MKFHSIRFILLLILFTMFIAHFNTETFSDPQMDLCSYFPFIIIDDHVPTFNNEIPEIINGKTFVPIRSLVEDLGGNTTWKSEKNTISIELQNNLYNIDLVNKTISLDLYDSPKQLDVLCINGVSYASLKELADFLDYKLYYTKNENQLSVIRIYKDQNIYINNEKITDDFKNEINAYSPIIEKKIIEKMNDFNVSFNCQSLVLKEFEPIADKLKVIIDSKYYQNFKIYWSQDINGNHTWEKVPYTKEQPCPAWYSFSSDQHTISAKIENMYTSKIITFTVIVKKPSDKIVYLTFDDGPNIYTSKILDILSTYNYKATFFMLSDGIPKHKDILERMDKEGHRLALHGSEHNYKKVYNNDYSVLNSMDTANKVLKSVIGYNSYICRSPYGSVPGMTKKQLYLLKSAGYKLWDWNIDSRDTASSHVTSNNIITAAISGMKNKKSSIILMHDKDITVTALPSIFKYISDNNIETKILDYDMNGRNFIEGTF